MLKYWAKWGNYPKQFLLGKHLFPTPLFDLSLVATVVLAFGLSFSSTVFAVKVLEDKGDMSALYGKVAIGILVMQDIFAVIFLAVSEGKYPSILALSVLLLFFGPVRKFIYKLIDHAGHGELLVLSGLFFALVASAHQGKWWALGRLRSVGSV